MSSPNEISSLQKIMVKPMSWKVLQSVDGTYTLQFTYVIADRREYAEVLTRRGEIKTYKGTKALLNDIASVQKNANVNFFFNNGY